VGMETVQSLGFRDSIVYINHNRRVMRLDAQPSVVGVWKHST